VIPKDCNCLAEVDFPMPRSSSTRRERRAVEVLGRGTNRLIEMCEQHGGPPPVFEETQGFLVVTFRAPLVAGGAAGTSRSESGDQVTAQVTEQVGGQVTGQVTGQVAAQVPRLCQTRRKASEIRELLNLRHRETFTDNYLRPLLEKGWLEPTIPDKPRSRMQRYRTTEAGLAVATAHASGRPPISPEKPPDSGPRAPAPRAGGRKKTSKGRKGR
jgi:predicted HTH transcriptional regulator